METAEEDDWVTAKSYDLIKLESDVKKAKIENFIWREEWVEESRFEDWQRVMLGNPSDDLLRWFEVEGSRWRGQEVNSFEFGV